MFVSPEVLAATYSARERESQQKLKNASLFTPAKCPCCHPEDGGLKNASLRNQRPAWLETLIDSTGNSYNLNNTDDEELKQASNTEKPDMPNWLITFSETTGQY